MRTIDTLLALAIGLVVPLQAAVNNQLKITIGGSTVMAALVSFVCGTIALALVAFATQEKWGGLGQITQAPWWQLSGGAMGALFVFGSTLLAPRLGFAVMIALIIGGQTLSSLAFDRIGLLGVPVRELTTPRVVGALLTVLGVLLVNFGDRLEEFIGRKLDGSDSSEHASGTGDALTAVPPAPTLQSGGINAVHLPYTWM